MVLDTGERISRACVTGTVSHAHAHATRTHVHAYGYLSVFAAGSLRQTRDGRWNILQICTLNYNGPAALAAQRDMTSRATEERSLYQIRQSRKDAFVAAISKSPRAKHERKAMSFSNALRRRTTFPAELIRKTDYPSLAREGASLKTRLALGHHVRLHKKRARRDHMTARA